MLWVAFILFLFWWHDLSPLVLLELRVTANQYQVILTDHLYQKVIKFPKVSATGGRYNAELIMVHFNQDVIEVWFVWFASRSAFRLWLYTLHVCVCVYVNVINSLTWDMSVVKHYYKQLI